MNKKNIKPYGSFFHEPGTPFYPVGEEPQRSICQNRVVPSPFSYLTLPMGCSLIKDINMKSYDDSLL